MKYLMFNVVVGAALVYLILDDGQGSQLLSSVQNTVSPPAVTETVPLETEATAAASLQPVAEPKNIAVSDITPQLLPKPRPTPPAVTAEATIASEPEVTITPDLTITPVAEGPVPDAPLAVPTPEVEVALAPSPNEIMPQETMSTAELESDNQETADAFTAPPAQATASVGPAETEVVIELDPGSPMMDARTRRRELAQMVQSLEEFMDP